MKIDKDTLRDIGHSVVGRQGDMPPRLVLWTLAALTGGSVPLGAVAERNERRTDWRLVALTEASLITIKATSPTEGWTFDKDISGRMADATIEEARAIPRSDVRALHVVKVEPEDGLTEWLTGWRLETHHGDIHLPAASDQEMQESERIATALLADLG